MRDYDPTTGRYLQADPLGLIDGASVYGYAGQSPMMNADPTGQCFGPAIALAPACAAGAGAAALYIYRKLILKAAVYCGELIWEEFWIWYNRPNNDAADDGRDDDDGPYPDPRSNRDRKKDKKENKKDKPKDDKIPGDNKKQNDAYRDAMKKLASELGVEKLTSDQLAVGCVISRTIWWAERC